MSWKIIVVGVASQELAKEVSQHLVRHLSDEGVQIVSAEFQADKLEDSLNLLVARDEEAAKFVPLRDGGRGYEKAPAVTEEPAPVEPEKPSIAALESTRAPPEKPAPEPSTPLPPGDPGPQPAPAEPEPTEANTAPDAAPVS